MTNVQDLSVAHVSVSFGDVQALRDVTAVFGHGVNAILGPNGAGKSTLFRVITGALEPRAGDVVWHGAPIRGGRDLAMFQRSVGYLPQDPGWFEGFTVTDLCGYMAGLRGVSRAARPARVKASIAAVGLQEKSSAKLKSLSGGQRRRAFIAQALVHDPGILVLDEPTSGLDPVQRIQLRALVVELGAARTVLLSTHLVEDVVHAATAVFVLDRGSLLWHGSVGDMARHGAARSDDDSTSRHERAFLAILRGGESA